MTTPPVFASTLQATLQSEEYYRLLVENFDDFAFFLLSTSGYIATWNAGAQRITQYSSEESLGKHISMLYPAELKSGDITRHELQMASEKGAFEQETWRVKKDGDMFWASIRITPVLNNAGELIGYSKTIRDLSLQKKNAEALQKAALELKESEERYRLLVEGVRDYAIFMLDPQGHVATWNEGARRIKGYSTEEITGKYFGIFYSQEALDTGFPAFELEQAIKFGRFEDEGWRYRKDGTAFWANVIITAIYRSNNELLGFSKITRDLTDRKQLEEKLRHKNVELQESEKRLRLLIDSVKDYAILMLDPEGKIISWNKGAERIKGYKAAEIIGRHFSTFYTPDAIEKGFPQYELEQALKLGRFEDEGWRLRKKGTAFWANVIISPIYDSENQLLGFAKITRDLTERRRNEELMEKNKELVRINNELDNFVYTASHDLKSPVVNLEGLLTALNEDLGEVRTEHEQLLLKMDNAIHTLKNVINDLADVTRLQQGKDKTEKIDIIQLVGEIKDSLHETILESQAEIVVDTSTIPAIYYSRKNLRSILYNLISNAIKYAHPLRLPQVRISTCLAANGETELSVSDNGLGVDIKQTSKIFALFKRAHDHVEGSGVGLYLVRKILENSGDRITVQSEPGQGSVFTVYFRQERDR